MHSKNVIFQYHENWLAFYYPNTIKNDQTVVIIIGSVKILLSLVSNPTVQN